MCAQQRLRSAWSESSLCAQAFFMGTAKCLIRLGGCQGWSESSVGARAILLVLSWGGSFYLSASFTVLCIFIFPREKGRDVSVSSSSRSRSRSSSSSSSRSSSGSSRSSRSSSSSSSGSADSDHLYRNIGGANKSATQRQQNGRFSS